MGLYVCKKDYVNLEDMIYFEPFKKSTITIKTMSAHPIHRPPRTMLEVFKSLPEGTLVQLIENNLIMSPSPLDVHQKVLDKLYRSLGNFVEEKDLGITRVAPYDVYLDNENAYQPDMVFVSKERLHFIQKNGLHGAPDLVIEILSPSTARYDQTVKKAVYERCGVREYWIVEPDTKKTTGFTLEAGKYVSLSPAIGIIHSTLLGTTFTF